MGEGVLGAQGHSGLGTQANSGELLADAGLERRGGSLLLAAVPLSAIAEGAGTPAYVYNAEVIRRQYRILDQAFAAVPHRIAYAVKANANLAVLRILRDLGAGADIVLGGELARALAAGFPPPDRIVFSGVGKSDAELTAAVDAGLGHIHLESAAELAALGSIAAARQRRTRVGIRVNPDAPPTLTRSSPPARVASSSGSRSTRWCRSRSRCAGTSFELDTIAMHIGSQLLDPAPYIEGIRRLLDLVARLREAGVTSLRHLDVGGGIGIRYRDERPMVPDHLAAAIVPLIRDTGLTLVLEPGRYLVGSAGVLLTTVLSRKHSGGKELVIVDAGMNDLVRPSHYLAYHEIAEVESAGRPAAPVDVVGPVCRTSNSLPAIGCFPGSSGASGWSYSAAGHTAS